MASGGFAPPDGAPTPSSSRAWGPCPTPGRCAGSPPPRHGPRRLRPPRRGPDPRPPPTAGPRPPPPRSRPRSMPCNPCREPACLIGCPTDAYVKLDNGVVAHRADECIGCQYCTWNCPYSVPVFQPDRRIVTKCDMCLPRLDAGLEPAGVGACPPKAISVGKGDGAAWRADHAAAEAPLPPPARLTVSTPRS